ncbi:hypothetical protein FAZ19_07535 [Sphingobacterium alkalisoli]|uniref:ATP synthase subunit I n=1 Tax=Sphingobacterium alkalisoli TaxID=1874115 RepID=A0A4U0H4X2_9SPHI|nr:ATP synthase subunit I [Sphingobacterium alkalisoli]TJY66761.1 hypothetical protein FAZ19_07535 [Sphingobacterium alkalisoli]GGH14372.1 F1F0 ATPase [Sphingobacterium alkalisoli]
MMNELFIIIWTLVAGFLLGVLFFGGLWLTVNKTSKSKRPGLLALGSFMSRMVIVLVGFYFIGAESWQRMFVAFAGLMIARVLITNFVRAKQSDIQRKEGNHEI